MMNKKSYLFCLFLLIYIFPVAGQDSRPFRIVGALIYIDPYYAPHEHKIQDSSHCSNCTHDFFIEKSVFSQTPYLTERRVYLEPLNSSDSNLDIQINYKVQKSSIHKDSLYKNKTFAKSHEIFIPIDSKYIFRSGGKFIVKYSVSINQKEVKDEEEYFSDNFYLSGVFKFGLGYSFFWYMSTQSSKSFYSGLNGFLELNLVKGLYLKAIIYDDHLNENEKSVGSSIINDIFSIHPTGEVTLDYHRWKRFGKLITNYGVGLGYLLNKSTETITKNKNESTSNITFGTVGLNLNEVFILDYPGWRNFGIYVGGGYFVGIPSICSAIYNLKFGLVVFPLNFH